MPLGLLRNTSGSRTTMRWRTLAHFQPSAPVHSLTRLGGHARPPCPDEGQCDEQVNDSEHHRQLPRAGEQSPDIHSGAGTESNDVAEDYGLTRRGRLRVSGPLQSPGRYCRTPGDKRSTRRVHPLERHRCLSPVGQYEPEAEERHINGSDTEQYLEFHAQTFSPREVGGRRGHPGAAADRRRSVLATGLASTLLARQNSPGVSTVSSIRSR